MVIDVKNKADTRKVEFNLIATIAVGAVYRKDLTNTTLTDVDGLPIRDFSPPRTMTIYNSSTATLKVRINNQGAYKILPPSVILELEDAEITIIEVLHYTGAASGVVDMNFSNKDTQLSLLQKILAKL